MPECRTELIADSAEYDPMVVIGEIAHVAAASDGGPRAAPEMGFEERNSYGNLILLCQNCHARIDGQQHSYSVERLKEIKAAHEAWVRASLPERGRSAHRVDDALFARRSRSGFRHGCGRTDP
jgi:hypothetical protein